MRPPALLAFALCLGSTAALAQPSAPIRKPGWWEMRMLISGPTPKPMPATMHICTDPQVDKVQTPFGVHMGGGCPPVDFSRTPAGWSIKAACKLPNVDLSVDGRASGDLRSHYSVDLVTRMNPPPAPQAAETDVHIDARWLGPCPAGKKPGDIEMKTQASAAPAPP